MAQVLVVDDDPLIGKTLLDLLSLHGFPATRAESGERGIEELSTGGFDLVLLDLRLPGMSGFETCSRIRELHGPHLPVIMMTAFGDPVAVRRGYEAGADDFLHKPIDTPALILKVRAFLRLKSTHDELARSREQAQARARDLARLHEIGRDWSLIAEPFEFNRMLTQRLAGLIGAEIVGIALHDPGTRTMEAALPVHGLSDERAKSFRYVARPEYRSLWSPRAGRPYVSNQPGVDPRLAQEIGLMAEADSVVLVPLLAEGELIGLLGAANKPGGFSEGDVQILSTFAGPVATFLRSRQIFDQKRRQAARFERLAALVGDMAAVSGRARLLELTVKRVQRDLGYERAVFHAPQADGSLTIEAEAGAETIASDPEALRWALRLASPLEAARSEEATELAVPVRAGDHALGVLTVTRGRPGAFDEEETSLLSTLGGQLALALRRAESEAATEHLARQMATLYDLGLETAALTDLLALFARATEEAGRLIRADHTSVFRFDDKEQLLRLFAVWASEPSPPPEPRPAFKLGEGIAGRVARDLLPVLVNLAEQHEDFVPRDNPVARILCVPLTHFDRDRATTVLYGVLNATRRPGSPPFTDDDLEYLTRFAGQLSIAVANSVAFAAERERSEQLALVNAVLRESAALLSKERILETAVRRIQEAFRPCLVAMLVPEGDVFRLASAAGRSRQDAGWAGSPLAEGPQGRALRERATIAVSEGEPGFAPQSQEAKCALAVPIPSGDEVAAVLYVEGDRSFGFDRGQVITLQTLADGIGILLRNAELYAHARAHERAAGGARPHQERARQRRGPRLPRTARRDPGLGGTADHGGRGRRAACPRAGDRERRVAHGGADGPHARDHAPRDGPVRLRLPPGGPRHPDPRGGVALPLRSRAPAAGGDRGRAAAGLGRRRADRRGDREPAAERSEVLAGRGRGAAVGEARARDRDRERERSRHRHRPRGPREAVPSLLAAARPAQQRDRGLRAGALDLRALRAGPRRQLRGEEPPRRGLELQLQAAAVRRARPVAGAGDRGGDLRRRHAPRRPPNRRAARLHGARGPGRRRGGRGCGPAATGGTRARAHPAAAASRRGGRAARVPGRDQGPPDTAAGRFGRRGGPLPRVPAAPARP